MKTKTIRINKILNSDTRYVFHFKGNAFIRLIAKNMTIKIKTNHFGLAVFCVNANEVKITHEKNWRKTYSKVCIITNKCCHASLYSFNAFMQKQIKTILLSEIKNAALIKSKESNIATMIEKQSVSVSNSLKKTLAYETSKKREKRMKSLIFNFKNISIQTKEQIARLLLHYQKLYFELTADLFKQFQRNMVSFNAYMLFVKNQIESLLFQNA